MKIVIIKDSITLPELKEIARDTYITLIKGVVDVDREIVAFGGEYHIDANGVLIADGSSQDCLWGFNILLEKQPHEWLEYTSLINIRPALGNRNIEVTDQKLRDKMRSIIHAKIKV